jgi:hypothetical protein
MKHCSPVAEGIMADFSREFRVRETGTGEQLAQLHDRCMKVMMTIIFGKLNIHVRTSLIFN